MLPLPRPSAVKASAFTGVSIISQEHVHTIYAFRLLNKVWLAGLGMRKWQEKKVMFVDGYESENLKMIPKYMEIIQTRIS